MILPLCTTSVLAALLTVFANHWQLDERQAGVTMTYVFVHPAYSLSSLRSPRLL
jgi:hypothetical protein